MVFLLIFVLGGFALNCSIQEVPRETPPSFEVQFAPPVQERSPDSQGQR